MTADALPYAFVIMPIGRPHLDRIFDEVIKPTIEDKKFGLKARRVDRDHEGGILGNHILDFIDGATLIVADLTHGRPNVYLEVGYAMRAHQQGSGTGTRKNPRLILMAKEDHRKKSPNFKKDTPDEIHFDLEDYGILFWKDAEDYGKQLVAEIDRRLTLVHRLEAAGAAVLPPPAVIDIAWVEKRQEHVNLRTKGLDGARTEFTSGVRHEATFLKRSPELLNAVRSVPMYGYGIGHVWSREEHAPKAMRDGGLHALSPHGWGGVQYWAVNPQGQFFRSSSLTEDSGAFSRREGHGPGTLLWIDARVREFIETLAFAARLYRELGLPTGSEVQFRYGVVGLAGRHVACADPNRWWPSEARTTTEETYGEWGSFPLGSLGERVVDLVVATLEPMFVLFELDTEWPQILKSLSQDILKDVHLEGL